MKCRLTGKEEPVQEGIVRVPRETGAGFTLLEVVIAIAIFFIAIFAILDLTSRCLRSARSLQHSTVTASSLAAELSLTNKLTEGFESGRAGRCAGPEKRRDWPSEGNGAVDG